jgi:hypothetical protein
VGKAALEMPGYEEPFAFRKLVGEAAVEGSHISVVVAMIVDSHATKPAETSLGAADMSVCATCSQLLS